ncbi:hypothetical protein JD844_032058 [Phrynosoma platyrhinos]|uniref:Solute carrier family 15 member 1 n=1 Tax=Phrynosoma platyrhinos TaxID=52577 RepID=A0ABQ7T440_PHRPL|nr:hypothetical protein JD844_032058 [Phrynosoma platyrhinos]
MQARVHTHTHTHLLLICFYYCSAFSMIGLVLIALGTGGIKPCVAAFGGDQFEDHQEKQRSTFFSIFYLSINAGSLLSTIITPMLRGVECGIHVQQKCYPLAFGVPAILMAIALAVFIAGSTMYKKVEPQGNIMVQVAKCITFAIGNRFRHRSKQFPKREHWLDWASEKYDGAIQIQPDQMQVVNPILIVIMVPVVDAVIYPLIQKCRINFTPLRKMTVGMLLAALAFGAAALVQVQIDETLPVFPNEGESQIKIINLGNDSATVYFYANGMTVNLTSSTWTDYKTFETAQLNNINNISITYGNETLNQVFVYAGKERHTLEITNRARIQAELLVDGLTEKPEQGDNKIRFINNLDSPINITMDGTGFPDVLYFSATNYSSFQRGQKEITVKTNLYECKSPSLPFGYGSAYTIIVDGCDSNGLQLRYVNDIHANAVSMAWQIPQYFLITCGEVVFSVTGLSFSYSQAPANMKSVLQAGWLLTVAVGNIIVLIIAGASKLSEQWVEYVLFAGLLIAVTIIFAIMAYFYTYVDPAEVEAQLVEEENRKNGKKQQFYENGSISQTKM